MSGVVNSRPPRVVGKAIRKVADPVTVGLVSAAILAVLYSLLRDSAVPALQRDALREEARYETGDLPGDVWYRMLEAGSRTGSRAAPVQVILLDDGHCETCRDLGAALVQAQYRWPDHVSLSNVRVFDAAYQSHRELFKGASTPTLYINGMKYEHPKAEEIARLVAQKVSARHDPANEGLIQSMVKASGMTTARTSIPMQGWRPLHGRELVQTDSLGIPLRLYVMNDTTLVAVSATSPFIQVVDVPHRRVSRSLVIRGSGVGEMRSARGIVTPITGDSALVYDVTAREFVLRRLLDMSPDTTPVRFALPDVRMIEVPVQLSPTRFIAHSLADSASFIEFDLDSGAARLFGDPVVFGGAAPFAERVTASKIVGADVRMCADPGKTRVARFYRYAGRGEILNVKTRSTRPIAVPDGFEPLAVVHVGQPMRYSQSRLAFLSCVADDSGIFALYSGEENLHAGPPLVSRLVQWYGWDGVLRETLMLSDPVIGLALNPRTRTLLGVHPGPAPRILDFGAVHR